MINLTYFNYMYVCMNICLYTCINKNNFNFSKMVIATKLKFSAYTKMLTTYRMVYHLYL